MKSLPKAGPDYGMVWFNPRTQAVYFSLSDSDDDLHNDWREGLKVKGVKEVTGYAETPPKSSGPWLRVKQAAIQDILGPIAQAGGWKNGFPASAFGGPNPLSATIASGALGAGAGYGLGALAEQVLPEKYFRKGRLRKTLGVAGGLAGALPGFWASTVNWRNGTGVLDPIGSASQEVRDEEIYPGSKHASVVSYLNSMLDIFAKPDDSIRPTNKIAADFDNGAGGMDLPPIEKDEFNRVVWRDPRMSEQLKGMTSGVLEGASQISGNDLISPRDVARLGVGMGSGWASGLIVGKTLGALAGLSPDAQISLQRAGVFAGLVTNVVPMIFGR